MKHKKNPHGGRRVGAGRPPLPENERRTKYSVWLTPAEAEWLERLGGSVNAGVRRLLDSKR